MDETTVIPAARNRERRPEVLAAALRQFARHGYRRTRLEDVAGELGLSKGALYFYADGKEALYREAVEWALAEWCSAIERDAARAPGAAERLGILARASFEYLDGNPDLRAVVAQDRSIYSLDPAADRFAAVNERARGLLTDTLEEGMRSGAFRPDIDAEAASRFLYQVYIAFLIKAFALGEGAEAAAQYAAGVDIALRGLLAR